MSLKATFRVIEADLITTRTDYLILNPYSVYFGSVEPSNLDYLEQNVSVVIPPIRFERANPGFVTGFYGPGHYFTQIDTVSITLSSLHPSEPLRVNEYGNNVVGSGSGSGSGSESDPRPGGFLFIGEPNTYGIRKVIYRGKLVSTTILPTTVVSLWLLSADSANGGHCEISLEAYGNPMDAVDTFILKFPNMPGPHTADLVYGGEFLPPCE